MKWWQLTVLALVGGYIKPHLQNHMLGFFDTIAMQLAISSSCARNCSGMKPIIAIIITTMVNVVGCGFGLGSRGEGWGA
jgi:hypothetical protein